jgi:hypothetical protein
MATFEAYLPKMLPGWLRRTRGRKYMRAVGRRMDGVVQSLRDAGVIKFPALAPVDALPFIAYERGLPRGAGETELAHRTRLANAWELWEGDNTPVTGEGGGGGSPLGMLRELKTAGIPTGTTGNGVVLVQQNGRYAQLDSGDNLVLGDLMDCQNRHDLTGVINPRPGWTFEPRNNFYAEFGLVFPEPAVIDAAVLNAVVEKWRPQHMLYIGAWIIETGVLLGWPPSGRQLDTEPALGGNLLTFIPGAGAENLLIGYEPLP